MPTAEQKTCANPDCNCDVKAGESYCGPSCAMGTQRSEPNAQCQCGHPGCKAEAKVA